MEFDDAEILNNWYNNLITSIEIICTHNVLFHNTPEIFIVMNVSYPTKSSQNLCPIIVNPILDQSFLSRCVLQVRVWAPPERQHF